MPRTEGGTFIHQVGTIGIPVADQDRALAFYLEKLGFEKRIDVPYGKGERWVEVAPPGAVTTIRDSIWLPSCSAIHPSPSPSILWPVTKKVAWRWWASRVSRSWGVWW